MKKFLHFIFNITVAVLLTSACAPSVNNNTAGQTGAAATAIKIGVNMELSGDVASYGESTVNGIQMAIDEINAAGGINGKKVEIVKYDRVC